MALYYYVCPVCNADKEILDSFPPYKVLCKKCRAEMQRKYTGVMVKFKGEGWTPKKS